MWRLLMLCLIVGCYEASAYKVIVWKSCKDPQLGKVSGVESSEPCDGSSCQLKRGTNVTFTVHFSTGEDVTAATAKVYGDIAGIKIKFHLPNSDGCKNCGLTCPLKSGGAYTYHSVVPVLSEYPKLKVVVIWYLIDQNGKNVWCIEVPTIIS